MNKLNLAAVVLLLISCGQTTQAITPDNSETADVAKQESAPLTPAAGWIKTGSQAGQYDVGYDPNMERNGTKCGCVRSKSGDANGFAHVNENVRRR